MTYEYDLTISSLTLTANMRSHLNQALAAVWQTAYPNMKDVHSKPIFINLRQNGLIQLQTARVTPHHYP